MIFKLVHHGSHRGDVDLPDVDPQPAQGGWRSPSPLRCGSASCSHTWSWCAGGGRSHRSAERAGGCARPKMMECTKCRAQIVAACDSASRSVCGPCSERYRHRVRRVFVSGFCDSAPGVRMFALTLTAPGNGQHVDKRTGRVCECTGPEGVHAGSWHAALPRAWSDFITDVRRHVGAVEYGKTSELQRRGLIHLHTLVRSSCNLVASTEKLRTLAIAHGFGHELELTECDVRAAGYLTKYVTKFADQRNEVEWLDRATGEVVRSRPRMRTWTASRHWGTTMAAVKLAQQMYARALAAATAEGAKTEGLRTSAAGDREHVDGCTTALDSNCGSSAASRSGVAASAV